MRARARAPWHISRRIIWTVPTVGCQNQKKIEREERSRNASGGRYGDVARIRRGSMNLVIYKRTAWI